MPVKWWWTPWALGPFETDYSRGFQVGPVVLYEVKSADDVSRQRRRRLGQRLVKRARQRRGKW